MKQRYVLETCNDSEGKQHFIKQKHGNKVLYTVHDMSGNEGLVDRKWIEGNIAFISNARMAGKSVCNTADKCDKAFDFVVQSINLGITTSSQGLNVKSEYNIAKSNYYNGQINGALKNKQIDNYMTLAKYGIDPQNIYIECLKGVLKSLEASGNIVWMLESDSKTAEKEIRLFSKQEVAEENMARHKNAVITKVTGIGQILAKLYLV